VSHSRTPRVAGPRALCTMPRLDTTVLEGFALTIVSRTAVEFAGIPFVHANKTVPLITRTIDLSPAGPGEVPLPSGTWN
jgi:hypothetical protein